MLYSSLLRNMSVFQHRDLPSTDQRKTFLERYIYIKCLANAVTETGHYAIILYQHCLKTRLTDVTQVPQVTTPGAEARYQQGFLERDKHLDLGK